MAAASCVLTRHGSPDCRRNAGPVQKHYDVELTFTSNAIEGHTLMLRKTAEVIEHGSPAASSTGA
jgi:hypothetical protein